MYALLIAYRYFKSRKKLNFINLLTFISMVGIAVGSFAMIVVLSAFNGFEDLLRTMNRNIDPDLKISKSGVKYFHLSPEAINAILKTDGVNRVYEVLEDNALIMYDDGQLVVKVKGVSTEIEQNDRLKSLISAGSLKLNEAGLSKAVVSIGIQQSLGISLRNHFESLQIWYPKPKKQLSANPAEAFTRMALPIAGVIKLEESLVYVPLDFANKLFKKDSLRSSYEIVLQPGANLATVKKNVRQILGDAYQVLDSDEQHENFYRVMALEKLFVFLALSFILIISSFNIFVSISMVGIEKQRDLFLLQAMGASAGFIRKVFLYLGVLLAGSGLFIGLLAGMLLVYLQQTLGLVKLGMESTIVEYYPVKLMPHDLLLVIISVAIIALLAVVHPARKAASIKFGKV